MSSPLNPLAAQPQGHHHHHHGRLARRASIPLSPTQRLLRKKAHSAWRCEVLQHAIKEIEAGSAALADLTPDELSRDDDGDDDDDADDPLNVSFSECASSPDGDLGLAGCCSEKEPLLLTRDRRVHIDFSKIVVEAHLRSPAPPLRLLETARAAGPAGGCSSMSAAVWPLSCSRCCSSTPC